MDEKFTPLFVYPNPNEGYETGELAALIERPGLTVERAARQIRDFAQSRWIYPSGKRGTGPSAANVFKIFVGAAVLALSALRDAGIADRDVMGCASSGLWGWQQEQSRKSRQGMHPIARALAGTAKAGEWWIFHVRILRDDQTGARLVTSYVYRPEDPPEFSRGPGSRFQPETSITINLSPILAPFIRRVVEPAAH